MVSLFEVLVFANRVMHMISTMFVAGMCTVSYLASNNLFASSTLDSWATFFGAFVLFTGLFNIYQIHKKFKYWLSDRYVRNYVIIIFVKLLLVIVLTSFFDKMLHGMSIGYNSNNLNAYRFYSVFVIYLLSSYMKYYKEKYVTKVGSELDALV